MSHPNEARSHAEQANVALDRYEQTGAIADLDAVIASFQAAADAVPVDDPGRAIYLYHLVSPWHARFDLGGDPADLENAIAAARAAVALARTNAGYLSALSSVLLARFQAFAGTADLDEALSCARIATSLPPTRSSDGEKSLVNLAAALRSRYELFGAMDDLTESIELERSALALSKPGEDRKALLLGLSRSVCSLFEETRDPMDLDEAVTLGRRAVRARPQDDDQRQARSLDGLSHVLDRLAERDNSLDVLAEAVSCSRTAVDLTSTGGRGRERYLAHLVLRLGTYSVRSGNTAQLDESVVLARDAVVEHPGPSGYPLILMTALRTRYEWGGDLAALDEAVAVGRAGTALVAEDSHVRQAYLEGLAALLFLRFRQLGALADLDEAIAHLRALQESCGADRGRRADTLSSLGMVLWMRYERTRDERDLDESIELGREAVSATASRWDEARLLANFAAALASRFERNGAIEDLDEAITSTRDAIAAVVHSNEDLARYHANLAAMLSTRFKRTAQPANLDEAVDAGRRSIALVSASNPERSKFLASLGAALQERYRYAGAAQDASAAIDAEIEASAVDTAPARQRVGVARSAAAALVESGDLPRATDLLDEAVRLLPEVSPRRLHRGDQQHALGGLAGLAGEAAALVLADTRLAEPDRARKALSLLETGRAVLISQALDGRNDLSELRRRDPELAGRFVDLRDQLDRQWEPDLPAPAAELGAAPAVADVGGRDRHELAAEFAETLGRIRQLDGLASFGQPPGTDNLLAAARYGPVVVLNVSDYGNHALLVTKTGVTAVPLPALTEQNLVHRTSQFLSAREAVIRGFGSRRAQGEADMIDVLEWLWDAVAGPVLDALDYRGRPADDRWPRVWWVPCGLLGLLPIHAAGYQATTTDPEPSTVIDRVVSSYTPSLRALIHTHGRSAVSRPMPEVLAVAMPTTPGIRGLGRLPAVPDEIRMLRRYFPDLTVLVGAGEAIENATAEPTKSTVLGRLADHPVAHFSCHGHSDQSDPSRSRLLLQDHQSNPFTAASLGPVALDQAQLAYLSACSTAATRPLALLDESIHLASAFQIAGFRHVISTLWEILDESSVRVADDFYGHLRGSDGAFDVDRAAHSLHRATRAARDTIDANGRPQHPFFWASYVHIGA